MYNGKGYDTSCWFRYQNFTRYYITYRVEKNFLRENDVKFEFHFFFQGNQRYSFPNNREEKFQIRPTKADNVLPFLEQNFAEEKFSRYNELSVFIIFL